MERTSAADLPRGLELREALYRGRIFVVEPTAASLRLVEEAAKEVRDAFAGLDPRASQFALPPEEWFARVGALRKRVFNGSDFHEMARGAISSLGQDPAEHALDPPRLRAIRHAGHENPAAAAVYHAHRDVWYAHPHCMLTWWAPLHDVVEAETFDFYPDWFAAAAPNDSEVFDYRGWTAAGPELRIGWQRPDAGLTATYPHLTGAIERGRIEPVACAKGSLVLFAGAHLHQTHEQCTGRTRFSLDFRTVHRGDQAAGRGAPNVDDRSRGDASIDYLPPVPHRASPCSA